jgi:hypothetical protein
MSIKILYRAIGGWLAIVAVAVVLGLVAGVPLTLGLGTLVLFAGIVPPVIVFRLFGRPAAQTVAEMLRQ